MKMRLNSEIEIDLTIFFKDVLLSRLKLDVYFRSL